ncbi:MAG: Fe-S cluster assembly protein SufD [Planctomycetota bacterium]
MSSVMINRASALTADGLAARAAAQHEPAYLTERRLKALNHYLAAPMPGRHDEIWRRVEFGTLNLDAAAERAPFDRLADLGPQSAQSRADNVFWGTPDQAAQDDPALLQQYWNTEVFPAGVEETYGVGGKFHSLNQALWDSGYVLHVPKGVEVELPARARFCTRDGEDGIFPHNLVVLDEGASATVVEEYVSTESGQRGLCCPQTEIILGRGAKLRYILLQTTGPEITYIGAHSVHQYAGSRLTCVSAHFGSRLSKIFLTTKMLEPKACAHISGLYYGVGSQQFHIDTLQHHLAPECATNLLFRGALNQSARAVYRGLIRLETGAQKTDAYQQNRTLLLSDDARMDSIPGLEILANDVRCSHGATATQIDPMMQFYLMSRGLTDFQARKLILDGFFEEVIQRFGMESVIERMRSCVDQKNGKYKATEDTETEGNCGV